MNDFNILTPDSVVVRCEQLVGSQVENELVMIDIESGRYYGLNPVATHIWEQLLSPVRIADLCTDLIERYAVDSALCERDVLNLLLQMNANSMVRVVQKPAQ